MLNFEPCNSSTSKNLFALFCIPVLSFSPLLSRLFCSRPAALFRAMSVRAVQLRHIFADGQVLEYVSPCCVTFLLMAKFWGISVLAASRFC